MATKTGDKWPFHDKMSKRHKIFLFHRDQNTKLLHNAN